MRFFLFNLLLSVFYEVLELSSLKYTVLHTLSTRRVDVRNNAGRMMSEL